MPVASKATLGSISRNLLFTLSMEGEWEKVCFDLLFTKEP